MNKSITPEDTKVDGMIGLFNLFRISDPGNPDSQNDRDLREAINNVAQAAAAIIQKASQIQKLVNNQGSFSDEAIAEVCVLRKQVKKLPNVANTFVAETERSVTAKVISLGGYRDSHLARLVSYFHPRITALTREVLKRTPDGVGVLWKVAEECYSQARTSLGRLYPYDEYFVTNDGTGLMESTSKLESELTRRDWVGFWIKALAACPEGPTLFRPPPSLVEASSDWSFTDVPRYLFRVFDSNSSGTNNDNVVSSSMEESGMLKRSKIDILSLEDREGTEMLYNHLNKGQFNAARLDNLMSWSSSLLFIIQYAVWRNFHGGLPANRIQICAVDTRRFPAGQFAQDMKLLRLYRAKMDISTPRQQFNFFQFRLGREEYNNGEYLSQGKLNHHGRSCLFSLEDLIEAGLCQLYPEFGDCQGKTQWTNRVKSLRDSWSHVLLTSVQEIDNALAIARECFGSLDQLEIALLLLAFKNRKIETKVQADEIEIKSMCEPKEVQRYETLARILEQSDETMKQTERSGNANVLFPGVLQNLFGCRPVNRRSF